MSVLAIFSTSLTTSSISLTVMDHHTSQRISPVIPAVFIVISLLLGVSVCDDQLVNKTIEHKYLFPGQMIELNISGFHDHKNYDIEVSFPSSNETSFALRFTPDRPPSLAVYDKEATNTLMYLTDKKKGTVYRLNVTLYYCPPGFVYTAQGTCECPLKTLNPNIACSRVGYYSGVTLGYCASRESGKDPLLIARCGYANHVSRPLLPIQQDNRTGHTIFCQKYSRTGQLCSECKNGSGLSVFSDTFDCIPCSKFEAKNLILYLVIELVPTTVFVLIILFFHIGITTGPVTGYIFFAQMITTPLEVLFLTYSWRLYMQGNDYLAKMMPQWIINPYCMWNLTFYRIFQKNLCLHPSLRMVHVLALRLVLAFYPLLLVIITYLVIQLKARNIRILTWLWGLVCLNCVRWRRIWQAKTSVINAFASCVLLSYSKFVQESLLYVSPSEIHYSNGTLVGRVLSFDTSMHFLGRRHMPYAIVAIVMLLTFGVLPPLILTFYQFRLFQNCLDRMRLRGVGLQRFVEAFQGCYRDGTDGNRDCRFFAGLYFLLRCVILIIISTAPSFPDVCTFIIITLAVFLVLLAVFQPYKKKLYNVVDCVMIFVFITVTALQMYIYNILQQTLTISRLFILYYILLCVPLVYFVVYVVNWIYRKWKHRHNRRLYTPVEQGTDFFREPALEEHTEPRGKDNYAGRSTNIPSQTEVSVTALSDEEDNHGEKIEGQGHEGQQEEIERDQRRRAERSGLRISLVGENLCNERHQLVHRELTPVTYYGSLQ